MRRTPGDWSGTSCKPTGYDYPKPHWDTWMAKRDPDSLLRAKVDLEEIRSKFGLPHPAAVAGTIDLAVEYVKNEDLDSARELVDRLPLKPFGDGKPWSSDIANSMQQLGWVYQRTGYLTKAREIQEHIFDYCRVNYDITSVFVVRALYFLGTTLRELHDAGTARRVGSDVVGAQVDKKSEDDLEYVKALRSLATLWWRIGQPVQAQMLNRRIIRSCIQNRMASRVLLRTI